MTEPWTPPVAKLASTPFGADHPPGATTALGKLVYTQSALYQLQPGGTHNSRGEYQPPKQNACRVEAYDDGIAIVLRDIFRPRVLITTWSRINYAGPTATIAYPPVKRLTITADNRILNSFASALHLHGGFIGQLDIALISPPVRLPFSPTIPDEYKAYRAALRAAFEQHPIAGAWCRLFDANGVRITWD